MTETKVKVFFDGLCLVCAAEISHYKKMNGSERIDFIDITGPGFDARAEKLDPLKVHKELHGKDTSGKLYTGVDTFILIWSQLDKLKWLAKLAQKMPVKEFLKLNYKLFVRIRPYLPRKSCDSSPYCESRINP